MAQHRSVRLGETTKLNGRLLCGRKLNTIVTNLQSITTQKYLTFSPCLALDCFDLQSSL